MSNRGELLTTMTAEGVAIFQDGLGYVRPGADYWHVEMGRLDHLNGPSRQGFPAEVSALYFAQVHKERDPHRDVSIRYPDGRIRDINLTTNEGDAR